MLLKKVSHYFIAFWLVVIPIFLIMACPSSQAPKQAFEIVATTGMIGDVVKQICGDRAHVVTLMGAGVDPHLYKPTRSDIAKLMSADLVFYNGLLLEGKMSDALIRTATSGKKVFPVTELLDEKFLLEPKEFAGHYDPHVWMDPSAWMKTLDVIRDQLIEFDPDRKKTYQENARRYEKELARLDAYGQELLAQIPQQSRVLVTAHDAFNYFGKRYSFEVLGIQGISTESEAGVKDIETIVATIVARKIPAVFVESTVSERNVRALIAGAKAKSWPVKIGGKLYSDAMGPPGTYEGTYIGMIDHNITTIARALGSEISPKGLNQKLTLNSD